MDLHKCGLHNLLSNINVFDVVMVVEDRFTKWEEFFLCMITIDAKAAGKVSLRNFL